MGEQNGAKEGKEVHEGIHLNNEAMCSKQCMATKVGGHGEQTKRQKLRGSIVYSTNKIT